jgi:hypothetical protein
MIGSLFLNVIFHWLIAETSVIKKLVYFSLLGVAQERKVYNEDCFFSLISMF